MANDNPFKDIKQDDLLSDDGVFQPLIDNKLEMIALNPIVSSVDDETLTQTITTAEDFVGLVEDENYLQHSQATSFNKYYSKKIKCYHYVYWNKYIFIISNIRKIITSKAWN